MHTLAVVAAKSSAQRRIQTAIQSARADRPPELHLTLGQHPFFLRVGRIAQKQFRRTIGGASAAPHSRPGLGRWGSLDYQSYGSKSPACLEFRLHAGEPRYRFVRRFFGVRNKSLAGLILSAWNRWRSTVKASESVGFQNWECLPIRIASAQSSDR